MWTTLALAASLGLAPAQAGKLEAVNVRPTYGVLGAPRADSKILPGDIYWLVFDVVNVQVDKKGKAVYGLSFEVTDSKGKPWLREEEKKDQPLVADNSLGGNRLPIFARVEVGLDMPAGMYTMKVTVTDRIAKTAVTVERKFEVVPAAFGLVRLSTSYDQQGALPAPMVGVPGQFMHVQFVAVGFQRDKGSKQPNLQVELVVLDESKKPVTATPDSGTVNKGVAENVQALPMGFVLALNRPGKFTVELKATDNATKKTVTLSFPLTVLSTDGGK